MYIKNKLLIKLNNLTSCAMDMFLELVKRQDFKGFVRGVHNQDICKSTGMSKQSFYNALAELADKNIITYEHGYDKNGNYLDYHVTILDNDFSYKEAMKEGFVSLQRSVFHKDSFKKLKSKEKFLVLWFIHITNENTSPHIHGVKAFYEKYKGILNVTRRVIRMYLHNIKEFFSIWIEDENYHIAYKEAVWRKRQKIGFNRSYRENLVKSLCRYYKVRNTPDKDIYDTAYLIKQYTPTAEAVNRNIEIMLMAAFSIQYVRILKNKRPKDRKLNPKYIHKLMRIQLGLEDKPLI